MAPSAVRRKLAWWQGQGLVKEEETDVFVLVEDRRVGTQEVIQADDDDDEVESAMASAAQRREQEMQMFWTYITGVVMVH
jgi:anaphase-promoting complex subunit 2